MAENLKNEKMLGGRKSFFDHYHHASKERLNSFHPIWRLVIIFIGISIMWFAFQYLLGEYPQHNGDVISNLAQGIALGERIFSWFIGGVFVGLVLFALMIEGEFLLSVQRFSRFVEKEARLIEVFREKVLKGKGKRAR